MQNTCMCVGIANISPSFLDVLTFILFHSQFCLQGLLEEIYWAENLEPLQGYIFGWQLSHVSWPHQSACSSSLPQSLLLSLGALGCQL